MRIFYCKEKKTIKYIVLRNVFEKIASTLRFQLYFLCFYLKTDSSPHTWCVLVIYPTCIRTKVILGLRLILWVPYPYWCKYIWLDHCTSSLKEEKLNVFFEVLGTKESWNHGTTGVHGKLHNDHMIPVDSLPQNSPHTQTAEVCCQLLNWSF